MSYVVISLLVGIAVTTWVYVKMMKNSGGLTGNALIVAGIAGGLSFVFLWSILSLF